MWVFVIVFTSISLVIEATIKSSTRDPALGKLKIFLFMGGENITERDISEKRLSIYFIGATLVLLLVSLLGLNLAKYYHRRQGSHQFNRWGGNGWAVRHPHKYM